MSDTQATHLIGRFVVLLLLKPVGDVVFPACLKARLHIMCFEVPAYSGWFPGSALQPAVTQSLPKPPHIDHALTDTD